MVELLATIVVLGLLMAVAIWAVSLVLNSSEENFYESLEKQVIMQITEGLYLRLLVKKEELPYRL